MLQSIFPHRQVIRPAIKLGLRTLASATKTNKTMANSVVMENLPPATNTRMARLTTEEEKKDGPFLTDPVFQHPSFNHDEVLAVKYEHRPVDGVRAAITYNFVRLLRGSYDKLTGFQEVKNEEHRLAIARSANRMTMEKWLTRFVVLESVAGIPGSVAGFLRHLRSMRMFRRDMGFIDTLYDEAFNERMHLLIFLKLAKPTLLTRGLLWVGQGIFANLFFITYVLSPRTCHRFVGYLEEEAVSTYTRCIEDLDRDLCPELAQEPIPNIAREYYHLDDKATMYDLLQLIRADEAKHREVNHTFANLDIQGTDRNPFALQVGDSPQPNPTMHWHHGKGWERKEIKL